MPVACVKLCMYNAIPQGTKIYTKDSYKEIYSKVLQINQSRILTNLSVMHRQAKRKEKKTEMNNREKYKQGNKK